MNLLGDPIFLLLGAVVLLLAWRLSGVRSRRLRKRRAQLRRQAREEASPRRRHELMQHWNELGGLREIRRGEEKRQARDQGSRARAGGRPLSANPYGHGLWGKGRQWKLGWKSVDRNIRWIERHRR
jgi:hypothetical protein